jgi:hypothetical protein
MGSLTLNRRQQNPPPATARAARNRDEEMFVGLERAILLDIVRAYLKMIARTIRTGEATPIEALSGYERSMADRLRHLPPLTQRTEPGIWRGRRPRRPGARGQSA